MSSRISPLYGKKMKSIDEIFKGDGITTCRWCGDTGYMHTYSNAGYFYHDAPCVCKIGQRILNQKLANVEE